MTSGPPVDDIAQEKLQTAPTHGVVTCWFTTVFEGMHATAGLCNAGIGPLAISSGECWKKMVQEIILPLVTCWSPCYN